MPDKKTPPQKEKLSNFDKFVKASGSAIINILVPLVLLSLGFLVLVFFFKIKIGPFILLPLLAILSSLAGVIIDLIRETIPRSIKNFFVGWAFYIATTALNLVLTLSIIPIIGLSFVMGPVAMLGAGVGSFVCVMLFIQQGLGIKLKGVIDMPIATNWPFIPLALGSILILFVTFNYLDKIFDFLMDGLAKILGSAQTNIHRWYKNAVGLREEVEKDG